MLPASIWRPTFDVREPNPYYRWSYSVPVTAPEHDTTVPVYEEHEPAPGSELAGHLTHTHGSSGSGDGSALELASEPGSLASGQHKFAHESADEPAEYGRQLQVPGTQPHEAARSLRTATELTRPHLSPSVDDTQQLAMLSRELGLSPKAYEHSLGATLHLAHLSGGRLAMPTSTTHALVSTQALKLALLLYCSCWLLAGSLLAPCWLLAGSLLAPCSLLATLPLHRLYPTVRIAQIEVGCSDFHTLDESVPAMQPAGAYLVSFEPLLEKYAVLLARGASRILGAGKTRDHSTALGHHHPRGVVLPMAVSPFGGQVNFTVSTSPCMHFSARTDNTLFEPCTVCHGR